MPQLDKETMRETLLSHVYVDQGKMQGNDNSDEALKDQTYDEYVGAYKQGVFDYMKEEYGQLSQEENLRHNSSGCFEQTQTPIDRKKRGSGCRFGDTLRAGIVLSALLAGSIVPLGCQPTMGHGQDPRPVTATSIEDDSQEQRLLDELLEKLTDSDWTTRRNTAEALGELGDRRAVEPLIKLLGDKEGPVRSAAVSALGNLGDRRAVKPLLELLEAETSYVRKATIVSLVQLGQGNNPEVISLKQELAEEYINVLSSNSVERHIAARELGKLGKDLLVDGYITALSSPDFSARKDAATALGRLGDRRAVKPLIKLLKEPLDPRGDERRIAAEALGILGDKRAVEPLRERLGDDRFLVRVSVAKALVRLGDKRDAEWLLSQLEEKYSAFYEAVLAANAGKEAVDLSEIVRALGEVGDKRAVRPLIDFLRYDNYFLRKETIEALGKIGNKEAVEPILVFLEDTNPFTVQAIEALGRLGDRKVLPKVLPFVGHPSWEVSWAAVVAAKSLGATKDQMYESLIDSHIMMLTKSDADGREDIAEALGRLGKKAIPILRKLLKDEDESVRNTAARALKKLEATDRKN